MSSEAITLAGVLPSSVVRMEALTLKGIGENNFKTPNLKSLWKYIDKYYDEHLAVLPEWVLKERASKDLTPEVALTLVEIYRKLSSITVGESDFQEAISLLKEDEIRSQVAEVLVTGREILAGVYYDEKKDVYLKGQEAAREYLSSSLRKIETIDSTYAPEGDVREDIDNIWEDYLRKEENPEELGGIKYGLSEVDEVTGGIKPGELALIAGFTGAGKSQVATSLAWNALRSGKNVLMFTTETTREEMEIRILSRHSRLPQFRRPGGLDSHQILNASLSPADREVFREVLRDFKNMNSGNLFMVQMPSDGLVDYVHVKAAQYNRRAPIDLIIVDSINLLRLPGKQNDKRVMLEDMLQDFKRFASSFDNGRGVGVVSPWQMSRTSWKEAKEQGGVYSLASLADTSEAEKSASTILSIFKDNDGSPRVNIQVLKHRSGKEMSKVAYPYDYRNSFIGESSDAPSSDNSNQNSTQVMQDIASFM